MSTEKSALNKTQSRFSSRQEYSRREDQLLKKDGNFAEHGWVGLVAHYFLNVFQLFDLANHLPEALIVIDQ